MKHSRKAFSRPGRCREWWRFLGLSVWVLALAGPGAAAASPVAPEARPARGLEDQVVEHGDMKLVVSPTRQEVEIRYRGAPLLRYAMASTNFKPYVKELRTLAGDNLLLDAPPDHLHHHGLMYAITVNGTNFWEEQTAPGVQRLLAAPSRLVGATPDGRPRATFAHPLAWVAGTHREHTNALAVAVLVERRTLTLVVDPAEREVALYWAAEFAVGPAAEQVTLSGTAYHGLGMRFVRDFDLRAQHVNSEGAPYSAEQKRDVIPARWAATLGHLDGRPVMAGILAGPHNAGSSRFFSMRDPFAYLSATQGLDEKPLTYQRGERFRLDYLVLARADHPGPEALEARYRKWLTELGPWTGR
jgi:hypothetical protein